jgi:hypothetical protein
LPENRVLVPLRYLGLALGLSDRDIITQGSLKRKAP